MNFLSVFSFHFINFILVNLMWIPSQTPKKICHYRNRANNKILSKIRHLKTFWIMNFHFENNEKFTKLKMRFFTSFIDFLSKK